MCGLRSRIHGPNNRMCGLRSRIRGPNNRLHGLRDKVNLHESTNYVKMNFMVLQKAVQGNKCKEK